MKFILFCVTSDLSGQKRSIVKNSIDERNANVQRIENWNFVDSGLQSAKHKIQWQPVEIF